jgi:hypothetical protein
MKPLRKDQGRVMNESPNPLYRVSAWDYLLAAVFLAASFASLIPLYGQGGAPGGRAMIYQHGALVRSIPLAGKTGVQLEGMEIEVSEAGVRVLRSDCPRQMCAHAGTVSRPSQTIVCVPNQVIVEIVSTSGKRPYDAVSY